MLWQFDFCSMVPKELTDTGMKIYFLFYFSSVHCMETNSYESIYSINNKILLTILIITITISPNVIGAFAALFFTNHSVQL